MTRVLPAITVDRIKYPVLRLNGVRGSRYLLRNEAGDLLGLYPYGGEPMRLYAAPLRRARENPNPFARFDFFDAGGELSVADGQENPR